MEFISSKGIYQQIADSICEKIVSGEFDVGSKFPSVREQSANLGVNQNTIMRTYTELQREEIITNKRGIGFFVTEDAKAKIVAQRKEVFFTSVLPEFMKQIEMLGIKEDELNPLFNQLKRIKNENK